jgi:hypothetical protein
MNARIAGFFFCSVLLHATLYCLFEGGYERAGMASHDESAEAARRATAALKVQLIAAARPAPAEPETSATTLAQAAPATADAIAKTTPRESLPAEPEPAGSPPESEPVAPDQGYLPPGRLTRPPAPREDIDLNADGVNEHALPGKMELTILVDASGAVDDVIISITTEEARPFAERIAQRFKMARFAPGEIDGKPVKSQLRIMVVSESLE